MGVIEIMEAKCTKCPDSQVCFYTVLNFEKNIQEIFTSELTCDYNTFNNITLYVYIYLDNWGELQYSFLRQKTDGLLKDIQDGVRYKKQCEKNFFFTSAEEAGLILFTDGVPLFKSSSKSLMVS